MSGTRVEESLVFVLDRDRSYGFLRGRRRLGLPPVRRRAPCWWSVG